MGNVILTLRYVLFSVSAGADPGGVQSVRIPALLITVPFFEKNIFSIYMFLAEQ